MQGLQTIEILNVHLISNFLENKMHQVLFKLKLSFIISIFFTKKCNTGHQQTTGSMSPAQLAQIQRQQQLQQLRLQQLQMDATQKQQAMQQQVIFVK